MKKSIVVYYSKTGSNKFFAEKIAQNLECDMEEIKPRLNLFMLLLFTKGFGNKPLKNNLANYERVILCGPVWMGKLVAPLRSFIINYKNKIAELYFVTCCASNYKQKDDKFGHNHVFKKVQHIIGEKCVHCEAFPIGLVIPGDKQEDSDTVMKTHLNNENFNGEILERFENFIQKLV